MVVPIEMLALPVPPTELVLSGAAADVPIAPPVDSRSIVLASTVPAPVIEPAAEFSVAVPLVAFRLPCTAMEPPEV